MALPYWRRFAFPIIMWCSISTLIRFCKQRWISLLCFSRFDEFSHYQSSLSLSYILSIFRSVFGDNKLPNKVVTHQGQVTLKCARSTKPSLVQRMACLLSTKPLHALNAKLLFIGQPGSEIGSVSIFFKCGKNTRMWTLQCRLLNGDYFVSVLVWKN